MSNCHSPLELSGKFISIDIDLLRISASQRVYTAMAGDDRPDMILRERFIHAIFSLGHITSLIRQKTVDRGTDNPVLNVM